MIQNIKNIQIKKSLPLLICDADEVIFEFMKSFEKYLKENQMYFLYKSFNLNGNIFSSKNNKPINTKMIPNTISNFFKNYTSKMPLINGAKNSLKELNKIMNIIILSNIPEVYALDRYNYLKKNNMNYYFLYNKGPKGDICKKLKQLTNKKTFFMDDLPNQLISVKKLSKEITTIHFLQNKKLLKILPKYIECDHKARDWLEAKNIILKNI